MLGASSSPIAQILNTPQAAAPAPAAQTPAIAAPAQSAPAPNTAGLAAQAAIQQNAQQMYGNYNQAAATPALAATAAAPLVDATQTQTAPVQSTPATATTMPAQSAALTLEQQVQADEANPLNTYGSNENGFGQYAANLIPALTLNPQLQNQLNTIMQEGQAAQYKAEAAALPAGSPYQNQLDQEAQFGYNPDLTTGSAYNAAGQAEDVLDYGSAYNQVASLAQEAGVQLPTDLAAALQAMDAYAAGHSSLIYGDAVGNTGDTTNFGSGDATSATTSGYDVGQQNYTYGLGGGSLAQPTGGTGPGQLFGDAPGAPSAIPDYQGGTQPNVSDTGTPYQPGVSDVQPAAARIVPPPTPEPGIDPGTVQYPPTTVGGQQVSGQGNPAGNTQPYNPELPQVTASTQPVYSAPSGGPVGISVGAGAQDYMDPLAAAVTSGPQFMQNINPAMPTNEGQPVGGAAGAGADLFNSEGYGQAGVGTTPNPYNMNNLATLAAQQYLGANSSGVYTAPSGIQNMGIGFDQGVYNSLWDYDASGPGPWGFAAPGTLPAPSAAAPAEQPTGGWGAVTGPDGSIVPETADQQWKTLARLLAQLQ